MNEQYWCMDCNLPVELDTHGKCGMCGSIAVDSMERPNRGQQKRDLAHWKRELKDSLDILRAIKGARCAK